MKSHLSFTATTFSSIIAFIHRYGRKAFLTILLLGNLMFASNNTNAQSFNQNLANMLQDTLDTYVSMISNIKGMSAGVYLPGQGIWQGTSGVSYAGQPITKDMKFGIASNTKLFTSTAMLILAENGIISLDDSLHKWLPVYPNVDPDITIRQLLNHTSGISDPIFVSPWMDTINANPTRVFTPEEVLSWLGAPTFAPGTGWGYSNINYILAGMIAENATGYHISKIIRDSILAPLNMDSTFYDVEEAEAGTIAHRWWNTIDYHDTSRVGINSAGGSAGAMFSNSSEMAQWYHALFGGQILNQTSMTQLTEFVPTTSPDDYGLGIDRETTQGLTYWGHGGSIWGYRSKMIYDTCRSVVVCGLTNCYPSGMDAVTFMLYRTVVNHIPGCNGEISGITSVCRGESSITYTTPSITNATSYIWTLPTGASGTSNTNSITVDYGMAAVSGNITVKGTNSYGDGVTASLHISVNIVPAGITLNENSLSADSLADSYQWIDCGNGNLPVSGETSQSFSPAGNGNYAVVLTRGNCTDTSACIPVIITGLTHESNSSISVYPNPGNGQINFSSSSHIREIKISDIIGQVIYQAEPEKNNVSVILEKKGIYYYQCTGEQKIISVGKIVIR